MLQQLQKQTQQGFVFRKELRTDILLSAEVYIVVMSNCLRFLENAPSLLVLELAFLYGYLQKVSYKARSRNTCTVRVFNQNDSFCGFDFFCTLEQGLVVILADELEGVFHLSLD